MHSFSVTQPCWKGTTIGELLARYDCKTFVPLTLKYAFIFVMQTYYKILLYVVFVMFLLTVCLCHALYKSSVT